MGTTSKPARHLSRPARHRWDARPTSRPAILTVTSVVRPTTASPSTSTSTWIAVAAGTSRGVSTRTIRTFGPVSLAMVTVATGRLSRTGSSGYVSPITIAAAVSEAICGTISYAAPRLRTRRSRTRPARPRRSAEGAKAAGERAPPGRGRSGGSATLTTTARRGRVAPDIVIAGSTTPATAIAIAATRNSRVIDASRSPARRRTRR